MTDETKEELRTLFDSEIFTIEDQVVYSYKVDKQKIWFCLSEWLAKAKVSPISAAKILKILYENSKDKDPISERVKIIVHSYRKAGIDIEPYKKEFEEALGVSGLDFTNSFDLFHVDSLQELLMKRESVARALYIIKRIEEILGTASPFRDSVFGKLSYSTYKQTYVVANLLDLQVVKAIRIEETIQYIDVVFEGAPTELTVIVDPLTGEREFQIKWEVKSQRTPILIPPSKLNTIVAKLKSQGFVISSRDAADALSVLINAYIEKGKAIIKEKEGGVANEHSTQGS